MNILFLHNNFPAQYRWLAPTMAADKNNKVVFGSIHQRAKFPNVINVHYEPARKPAENIHHYLHGYESSVLTGQAAFRMGLGLREKGFIPDVICAHAGWGPGHFMKEVFPEAKLLGYFEWYYNAKGADFDFFPDVEHSFDDLCRLRIKNCSLLTDLMACDWGTAPTMWQWSQIPKEIRENKINILHDGINTQYMIPEKGKKLVIKGLDLSHAKEIVTFVGRGMEPYRGFMQFMEMASILQQERPNIHIVVVGSERVVYGRSLQDGKSYKQKALNDFTFDLKRIHFTGSIPYGDLRTVLQASDAHVYLTAPFVLSWSMLEAMSAGCLVIGSDTAPVREVIQNGVNGFLVDFFSPVNFAQKVSECLDHKSDMEAIRIQARKTILSHFKYEDCLEQHIQLIQNLAKGKFPSSGGRL